MLQRWRWDQGRLGYFLFDNIKAMALTLVGLDGTTLKLTDGDLLRAPLIQSTQLPFKPAHYTVWRNYKRVFECSLLATQINGRLCVSDICRSIADPESTIDADEYLSLHLSRFRYPFPAFVNEAAGATVTYPFSAILKFLIAQLSVVEEASVSPEMVISWLIGNKCTGLEEDSFYQNITPTTHQLGGDDIRQIREMLIFISQLSALKWHNGRLILDISVRDLTSIQTLRQLANPVYSTPKPLPGEDFMAITTLSNRVYQPLVIPSRELLTDELFTEGKRTRVTHIKIERSPLLRRFFLQKYPEPICDMCQANMRIRYPWTKSLIEVHHLLPLSSTLTVHNSGTSLDDVVGLCPNCHRSVHSFYKLWLDDKQSDDFRSHVEARAVYAEAKSSIVL